MPSNKIKIADSDFLTTNSSINNLHKKVPFIKIRPHSGPVYSTTPTKKNYQHLKKYFIDKKEIKARQSAVNLIIHKLENLINGSNDSLTNSISIIEKNIG